MDGFFNFGISHFGKFIVNADYFLYIHFFINSITVFFMFFHLIIFYY